MTGPRERKHHSRGTGRRGLSVDDDARWVFNQLADAYRSRPPYPQALIDRLVSLAGGRPVVDLGAGTGLVSSRLAERGLAVTPVEPARRMFEALDNPRAVHAAAEDTGLPAASFGLAMLVDVLHWVDPELAGKELGRLLLPDGVCAVVEQEPGGNPFTDALMQLMEREKRRPARTHQQLFRLAVGPRPLWTEQFADEAVIASVSEFVRSFSRNVDGVKAEMIAKEHGAVWRRTLRLTWARKA